MEYKFIYPEKNSSNIRNSGEVDTINEFLMLCFIYYSNSSSYHFERTENDDDNKKNCYQFQIKCETQNQM